MAEAISVSIRVRPVPEGSRTVFSCYDNTTITQTEADERHTPVPNAAQRFNRVFAPDCNTEQMHDEVTSRIVNGVVDGINGTVFAYGQTASGKTFTMQGTDDHAGILQLASSTIFERISKADSREFLLRASYVEIYNEEIRDLLNPKGTVKIREDPTKGVYIECKEEIITNFEHILKVLRKGEKCRSIGVTNMNKHSSRSHTIFRLVVESRERGVGEQTEEVDGGVLAATLNLVDLAGSESVRLTGAEGQRLKEAGNINKSLLTLSRVIQTLGEAAKRGVGNPHVMFRDSKLTRVLQPSLAGNTRTAVICCISPLDRYLDETVSTLKFAGRASSIKTEAQVNELLDTETQLKRLQKELKELKEQQQGATAEEMERLQQEATAHKELMEQQASELSAYKEQWRVAVLSGGTSTSDTMTPGKVKTNAQKRRVRRQTFCAGGDGGGFGSFDDLSRKPFGRLTPTLAPLGALAEGDEDESDRSCSMRRSSSGSASTEAAERSRVSIGSTSSDAEEKDRRIADLEREVAELKLENENLAGFRDEDQSKRASLLFGDADVASDAETECDGEHGSDADVTVEIAKQEDVVSVKELQETVEQLQQEKQAAADATQAELQLKDEAHSAELAALRAQLEEAQQLQSNFEQQSREQLAAVEQEKAAQERDVEKVRADLEKAREELAASEQEKTASETHLKETTVELEQLREQVGALMSTAAEADTAHASTLEQLELEQTKSAQLEQKTQELSSKVQEQQDRMQDLEQQAAAAAAIDSDDDDVTAEIVKAPTQEELNTLQARVDELQAELASTNDAWGVKFEKQVSEHVQILATKDVERAELEATIQKRADETKNALEMAQAKVEEASEAAASNSTELEQRVETLTQQLQTQKQQESSMESAMIEAAEETATMRTQLNELEESLAAAQQSEKMLKAQDATQKEDLDAAQQRVSELTSEVQQLKEGAEQLVADVEKANRELSAREEQIAAQATSGAGHDDVVSELERTQQERDVLRKTIESGKKQIRSLKEELENAGQLRRRQWQDAQEQQNAAEDEIEKLNSATEALKQELKQSRSNTTEVAKLKEQLAATEKRCIHLDARKLTKEQCAQLMKVKREHKQFKIENKQLKKKLDECDASGESKARMEQAETQNVELQSSLEAVESDLRKSQHEVTFLSESLKEVEAKVEQLQSEIHDRDAELRNIEAQSLSSAQRAEMLGEKEQSLQAAKETLAKELAQANHTGAQQAQQLEFLKGEMEMLQTRNADAIKKSAELQADLKDARSSAESNTAEHQRTVGFLEQENLQLMLELKTLHAEHRQLQLSSKQVEEQSQQLQQEMARLQTQVRSQAAVAPAPAPVVQAKAQRETTPLRSLGNDGSTSAFGPTPGKKQQTLSITPEVTTNKGTPSTAQLVAGADSLLAQMEADESAQGDENAHSGGMTKVPMVNLDDGSDEGAGECNTQ